MNEFPKCENFKKRLSVAYLVKMRLAKAAVGSGRVLRNRLRVTMPEMHPSTLVTLTAAPVLCSCGCRGTAQLPLAA